ncbi:winged helix-turn-helix transcriptional regulator [Paenibacillus agaridevorans]|uniref:winged helix-turn-helix transcriptional regulator n=1 Tax=Paenibacillus agaridevorans TaxID=171404 RepID=UPI00211B6B23|nr:winged helix-turn-helix transcriptional regulator [Paenibacillus agaridevorans]
MSGQWTVPLLLEVEPSGGRFTPLQNRLQITPARLSDNLKRMAEHGLLRHLSPLERRHPALPEYVLTEKGLLLRDAAKAVQSAEGMLGYGRLSAKAWNLPLLLALHYEHTRFQDIRFALGQVTPRMLSGRLDELQLIGAVDKSIAELPRPAYIYLLHQDSKPPVRRLAADLSSLL